MNSQIILIVDDEDALDYSDFFEVKTDFKILTAEDGGEAIKIATKIHPDLILLDVQLPVFNGFEVLEELKKREIKTRVVMISGAFVDANSIIRGIKGGACDYILKPLDINELINKVKKYLIQERTINFELANISPFIDRLIINTERYQRDTKHLERKVMLLRNENKILKSKTFKAEVFSKITYVGISLLSIYAFSKMKVISDDYLILLVFLILVVLLMIPVDKIQSITTALKGLKTKIKLKS